MVFGKIDYLNLLPFHVFLKSYPLQNAAKKSIEFKKGVPSKLCKDLYYRRIDAAVISSIESRRSKYKVLDFGICAKKDVKSVLVRKNTKRSLDPASMSSNMLSRILKLDGEVIIGDNALIEYLKCGEDEFYDMGKIWNQRTGLPFVFGRFTYIKNKNSYKKIIKIFLNRNIKIPKYILDNYSDYKISISATTRSPREGEVDGTHYHFLTTEKFEDMIKNNQLLEYANYVGNYYGTPRDFVEKNINEGNNVILEIETQGALQVKKMMPEAVMIFVLPPNADTLKERLVGRQTETMEVINKRLSKAAEETGVIDKYDYFVINDEIADCAACINDIVTDNNPELIGSDCVNKIKNDILKFSKGE